jgi:SAM-dependent methyltransferase
MFEVAEAYEVMMGRWSRQLAPLFVEFAGVRDGERVLDVGCGTGSLSATLVRVTGASKIVGIDPSKGFIEYARTLVTDPRVTFELEDAQELPYADGSFDRCMALLIVNFVPDAPKAANEMRRVTRKGGVVATTMWDGSRAHELTRCFWNAAVAIDPTAKRPAERRGSYGSAEALLDLLKGAGLTDIEVTDLTITGYQSQKGKALMAFVWRDFRKMTVLRCASSCGKIFSVPVPPDHLRFRPRRGGERDSDCLLIVAGNSLGGRSVRLG